MKATETEFVVFDVETTGLFPERGDRIIEIAGIKMKNGKIVETISSFINPQRDLPIEAQRVNNITVDMLDGAPVAEDFLPKFAEFIGGACLAGHNVKFDLDFVCYQLSLMGRKLKDETPAFDTLKMAKTLMPHLGSFRLQSIAVALGVKVAETHRALADVQLTCGILNRLLGIAEARNIKTFQDIHNLFSVQKPFFKIKRDQQEMLF
ncbi:MAG: hypothetical protein HQL23_03615 [Candidatus Omnitrophica bacterium]|nr:hypothetical protein [Candidatus Omnitrophota bacterium]